MISSNEFTEKIIEATLTGNDTTSIAMDYIQELLIDIGNRYPMTAISHPVLAAALKIHSDVVYSKLDPHGKRLCDSLMAAVASSDADVQEIRFPCKFKKFKKEDGE